MRQRTLDDWTARLNAVDSCWGPVLRGREILGDPHVHARDLIDVPRAHVAYPVMVDGEREPKVERAPELGADRSLLDQAEAGSVARNSSR